jgi:hypothetical protein
LLNHVGVTTVEAALTHQWHTTSNHLWKFLSWAGFEPGPSAPQVKALTTRPAGRSLAGMNSVGYLCAYILYTIQIKGTFSHKKWRILEVNRASVRTTTDNISNCVLKVVIIKAHKHQDHTITPSPRFGMRSARKQYLVCCARPLFPVEKSQKKLEKMHKKTSSRYRISAQSTVGALVKIFR